MQELISVIMSTYNEPVSYISHAVSSILAQTYMNIELIIVADNPDNCEAVAYLHQISSHDPRVRLIINKRNLGLPKSLNIALDHASGAYIARMDADDISMPERLEVQTAFLRENQLDLVGSNIRYMDSQGVETGKETHYPTSDDCIKRYLRLASPIPHPTWMIRRTVFTEIGGYESYPASQDYEFISRMALRGYRLGNIEQPLLKYRINSSGISSKNKILQKTIKYYIRTCYRAGEESPLEDFERFFDSESGKKKYKDLECYYKASDTLKTYKRENKRIKYALLGIQLFLSSKEARDVLGEMIAERVFSMGIEPAFDSFWKEY